MPATEPSPSLVGQKSGIAVVPSPVGFGRQVRLYIDEPIKEYRVEHLVFGRRLATGEVMTHAVVTEGFDGDTDEWGLFDCPEKASIVAQLLNDLVGVRLDMTPKDSYRDARCGVCGVPVAEHDASCSNHAHLMVQLGL